MAIDQANLVKKLRNLFRYALYLALGIAVLAMLIFALPVTGWKAFNVATGSMRPGMAPGTLVIVKSVPDRSLKVGDVITYNSLLLAHETVTHRIVKTSTAGNGVRAFVTKGDANVSPDPEIVAGQVVGKAMFQVPYIGGLLTDVRKPAGLGLLVILPCMLIIWYEIGLLTRSLAEPNTDEQAQSGIKVGRRLKVSVRVPVSKTSGRQVRSLDGLGGASKLLILLIAVGAILLPITHAVLTSNKVSLINSLVVSSKSPGPTPSPSPCTASITGTTGPGSTNIVSCSNTSNSTASSTNFVNITNSNSQYAHSGSSAGTSGSSTNTSTTSTQVKVSNF